MEARFQHACLAAGHLMRAGHRIFSPIAHTHPIAVKCELPRGWDFWDKFDRELIAACEQLWVLKIQGWDNSKGVQAEIGIAMDQGKTIRTVLPISFDVVSFEVNPVEDVL